MRIQQVMFSESFSAPRYLKVQSIIEFEEHHVFKPGQKIRAINEGMTVLI